MIDESKTLQQMTEKEDILNFILAGRAVFTLKSHRTGDHLTFKVRRTPGGEVFAVFGGRQKTPLGRLRKEKNGEFQFYPNRFADTQYVLAFHWNWLHLGNEQVGLYHMGRCGKCGRKLTDPVSIQRGLGPECSGERRRRKETAISRFGKLEDIDIKELFK